uniref:Uncharacterized protein n=1 Tax=Plectus sambesii TaxID=2011161 RepID=A0A914W5I8_9BILA
MLTEDKPHPGPLPAAKVDMLVCLFQEQQQQTSHQFQLLAEKISAASKCLHEPSPIHLDKAQPGDWHFTFNVRCIHLIQSLINCNDPATRNFDLNQNDVFPGYLNFKEEQAELGKQKEEGIDEMHLVAFQKQHMAASLSTV